MRCPKPLWAWCAASLCAASGRAEDPQAERPRAPYACLFNHELLIVSHRRDISPAHIASFVEKLAPTDVDAVMCCPMMWRCLLYPSAVDRSWQEYRPGQAPSKFRSYDYAMTYLHAGGDPVRDTLDACRRAGKAFFISYRMNDHHYLDDLEWPTHNAFWRRHPEYWLGDAPRTLSYNDTVWGVDDVRLLDYMRPEVRDQVFAVLEELCVSYDVDGLELDFQRFPKFFHSARLDDGREVMTAFLGRLRGLLDRIGGARGKTLRLCVRVPETLVRCRRAGLDVPAWDALGLVDMVNVSSFYFHTTELDIEAFKAHTSRARIYGEMNYVTYQNSRVSTFARRYTTTQTYHASALNLLHRGADGLSLFNADYVPAALRAAMTAGFQGITDLAFLRTTAKQYVVYPGFGSLPIRNDGRVEMIIPDDTSTVRFDRSVLRLETRENSVGRRLEVQLNGQVLEDLDHADSELFPPLAANAGYADREALRFYAVPLALISPGRNTVKIRNLDPENAPCTFFSLELALYR